jgi:selenocysteine lyase/cysteine desulfurase
LKVYGPHISALYVRSPALQYSVSPLVHHFLKVDHTSYKLQPGGPGYELVYATTGAVSYLLSLTPASSLQATWDAVAQHEQTLVTSLIQYLTDPKQWARGVRIVGDESISLTRVPTISFVVVGDRAIKSKSIVEIFDKKGGVSLRTELIYFPF